MRCRIQFSDSHEPLPETNNDNLSVLCQATVNREVTHEAVNTVDFQLKSVRRQAGWGLTGSVME